MDIQKAIIRSVEFLMNSSRVRIDNIKVEETTEDKDNNFILTLSYDVSNNGSIIQERCFKGFKVLKNGDIGWMKIINI